MTYCNPALPYRAKKRSTPSPPKDGAANAAWYEVMICALLSMLYARGFIIAARVRRGIPERERPQSYFYEDLNVKGARHLRADLRRRQGRLIDDFALRDDLHFADSFEVVPESSGCAADIPSCGHQSAAQMPEFADKNPSASVSIRGSPLPTSRQIHVQGLAPRGIPRIVWQIETDARCDYENG